ncbi:disease resistance protein RGA5-like [Panicum virgatum]|uniref:disease resistance protein RGA5-like n=1 Tax=Panicum virgatum TaxID=38727 RepID=UPI0019D5A5BC|nr:disease resistance protein RGA5-like [Panicum virgatum]
MERAIVSAAAGVMSSVLGKLADLLHEEYKLAKGVRKDIEFLRSELSAMNDLLYVLAEVEELDAINKGWRDRVRELAYDVEDCIDLSVARLGRADDAREAGRLGAKLARKFKKIRVSHQVAHQIKELKDRAIEESKRQKRYKLDGLVGASPSNKVDLRMRALWEETEKLVGLDGPRDEIIRCLMPEGEEEPSQAQQIRALAIVGCAGLGKTTLANQVYQKIKGDFECNAFVSVSQNPHLRDVLMKICSQVGATADSMADDELILVGKLRERLQNKRYIVVVDDIWHSDPWEVIGLALIKTSPGSIIIITTRLKDVAQSCCSSHSGRVYDMKPLDDDNSKRLFFKRIFDSEDKCPHELESASKDILKKCNGIPLAIISISNFLAAGVPQSPDHWNKVKESISSPLHGNKPVDTMKSVLSLSYFNLPHHLRTSLLYLSVPEDCEIERDRLVCRWGAEGFVNPKPGESPYEAGLRHFNILINRSLIQPWKEENGVVLSCRVHDVIGGKLSDLAGPIRAPPTFFSALQGSPPLSPE